MTYGCHRLKLSQQRFSKGRLYISLIEESNTIESLDVRYKGTPTRTGFRVSKESFPHFLKILKLAPQDIGNRVLWRNNDNTRSLRVRFCDDNYGKGVDFRYFKDTPQYTGWEKRGIRITLENYDELKNSIFRLEMDKGVIPKVPNLFDNLQIVTDDKATKGRREKKKVNKEIPTDAFVNSEIVDFLSQN